MFLSTSFSNTFKPCSYLTVREQVSNSFLEGANLPLCSTAAREACSPQFQLDIWVLINDTTFCTDLLERSTSIRNEAHCRKKHHHSFNLLTTFLARTGGIRQIGSVTMKNVESILSQANLLQKVCHQYNEIMYTIYSSTR
jgi:hypothetical protein